MYGMFCFVFHASRISIDKLAKDITNNVHKVKGYFLLVYLMGCNVLDRSQIGNDFNLYSLSLSLFLLHLPTRNMADIWNRTHKLSHFNP